MKTVGMREMKNKFSAYVRAARKGETVAITDRGVIVAHLAPPKISHEEENPFAEMARRGEATLGRPISKEERAKLYHVRPPRLHGITSAELLDAERGER